MTHHGVGGDWSLSAVALGLKAHGGYSLKHVGARAGLDAFKPDGSGRTVLGLLVLHLNHYTSRILRSDGSVLKLDSLRPDACLELRGAEIDVDLELHPCAFRVEQGHEIDHCDDVLQDIFDLRPTLVEVPSGLWTLDTSDGANPKLVWVPAKDLDAAVYAWMRTDKERPDDAVDEEPALVHDVPAGAGHEELTLLSARAESPEEIAAGDSRGHPKRPRTWGTVGDWSSTDPGQLELWLAWYRGPRSTRGGAKGPIAGCTVAARDCAEDRPCEACTSKYKKHKSRQKLF